MSSFVNIIEYLRDENGNSLAGSLNFWHVFDALVDDIESFSPFVEVL